MTKKATITLLAIIAIGAVAFLLFRNNQNNIKAAVDTEIIDSDINIGDLPLKAQEANLVARLNPSSSEAEFKNLLSDAEYRMLREGGTEVPYTSDLNEEKRPGTYVTADCGVPVFRSEQKFDSGTGWPSFWAPIDAEQIELKADSSLGLSRTEVVDSKCGSHLGHVFNDAPQTPTGLRYCLNGVALKFIPDEV